SDPIGDGLSFTLSPPFADGADHLTAGMGTTWLQGPSSEPIGVRYDSGTFRTAFLSAPFEGIPTPDQATVMARVLEWLAGASGAVGVSPIASVASGLELSQNSPNPFRSATTLRFAVPNAGPVSLSVFDVAGRRVAELVNGAVDAGQYTATWDGRNASGKRVASGVYLVRLEAGAEAVTREMVLLK
ncbi:MAG: T9SS type A sorting domain-containing protein, partial [Gemmatimonadetes bacterium]|nr:T9SS type A sorting domain-containing protein [Gemmatimonadota bacterium]